MGKSYQLPDESIEQIIAGHYSHRFSGVHPAADLLPMCTPEEFAALCDDVKQNGVVIPLLRETHTRLLLDGRNRLLACYITGAEFDADDIITDEHCFDALRMVISANVARRHLSAGQRAMVGARAKKMFAEEAKKRKLSTLKQNSTDVVNLPHREDDAGKSRDLAAATVDVSGSYIDRAEALEQYAPDQAAKVKTGDASLNEAYQQAKPTIEKEKFIARHKDSGGEMTVVRRVDGSTHPIALPKRPVFNTTNDSVGWAKYTWNPVTGCLHGCEFCYAREIANSTRMAPFYPLGFEPVLHEYRLEAPANTTYPKELTKPEDGRVFVCSMADLFGKWVPDAWIRNVFDAAMAAPQWEYLFLTKWPRRYKLLASLPSAWFGASVIRQADVKRVERDMAAFETSGIKWCSLEPMLEPIRFNDLSWCDLMVIGSQTATTQPEIGHVPARPAHFEWVADVVAQCRTAGVPYYLKTNLETAPGMTLPRQAPRKTA